MSMFMVWTALSDHMVVCMECGPFVCFFSCRWCFQKTFGMNETIIIPLQIGECYPFHFGIKLTKWEVEWPQNKRKNVEYKGIKVDNLWHISLMWTPKVGDKSLFVDIFSFLAISRSARLTVTLFPILKIPKYSLVIYKYSKHDTVYDHLFVLDRDRCMSH